jgi:hypothetical protein
MRLVLLFPLGPSKASDHRNGKRAFDVTEFLPAWIDEKLHSKDSGVSNATAKDHEDIF